jgi:hypothetical protein
MKRNLTALALLGAMLLGAPGMAHADLLAYGVRQTFATNVTSTFGGTTIIRIDDANNTTLTFTVAGTQPVLIAFNADCMVDTAGTALAVEILVDGTPAPGTGASSGGSLLCSSTDGFVAAVRNVVPVVSPGLHTVQVRVAIFSSSAGTYTAKLRRSVLTVES